MNIISGVNCIVPFCPTPHCIARTVKAIHAFNLVPFFVFVDNLNFNKNVKDVNSCSSSTSTTLAPELDLEKAEEEEEITLDLECKNRKLVEGLTEIIKDCNGAHLFKTSGGSSTDSLFGDGDDDSSSVTKNKLRKKKLFCISETVKGIENLATAKEKVEQLAKSCAEFAISQTHCTVLWPEEFIFIVEQEAEKDSHEKIPITWLISEEIDDPVTELMDLITADQEVVDKFYEDLEDGWENGPPPGPDDIDGLKFACGEDAFALLSINPTGFQGVYSHEYYSDEDISYDLN